MFHVVQKEVSGSIWGYLQQHQQVRSEVCRPPSPSALAAPRGSQLWEAGDGLCHGLVGIPSTEPWLAEWALSKYLTHERINLKKIL